MSGTERPFGSMENTQQFLSLLSARLDEITGEVREELAVCRCDDPNQRAQTWQLVLYTLRKLSSHISDSRKLMNDLTTMKAFLDQGDPIS